MEDARPVIQRVKALFECAGYDARLEFAEIQHQVRGTKDSLYTALSRLSGQGVLLKSPSKSDPRKKVYRLSPKYVIHTPPLPIVSQRLSDIMAETLTTQGLDVFDEIPDKMPGISDKIPDNQPNLDVCYVSETLDNQESQSLCLTDSYFQEGGGVNDSVKQVENITQSEDTTIGVEPEPIKVGDKVFVLHPQANENGNTVHEIGDGWVTVVFLTKQFPISKVVKM